MSCQDSQNVLSISKQGNYQPQSYILREDEKIPLFLIKLWNIVEDPAYYDVIRWDESGYSFHITDPYSFGRNVLPQFFKHNNLNSLIRQLNMYGFRKMTPIERTSLARAESDQDHLEFSHPYFVREHPELLVNIKRKVPNSRQSVNNASYPESLHAVNAPNKDLSAVLEELRQLRERQKNMENKINELVKENEMVWQEMGHMRGTHMKQQQIVNKLVQFLVLLVQPNKQQRLGKRQLLAIDEVQTKRSRDCESNITSSSRTLNDLVVGNENNGFSGHSLWSSNQQINANEVLDSLISEMAAGGIVNLSSTVIPRGSVIATRNGPIIADVTDELDQLNSSNVSADVTIDPSTQKRAKVGGSFQPRIVRKKTTVYNVRPVSKRDSTESRIYTNNNSRSQNVRNLFVADPYYKTRGVDSSMSIGIRNLPPSNNRYENSNLVTYSRTDNKSNLPLSSSHFSNQQQSYYGQQQNEHLSQSQNPQLSSPSQLYYASLPAICRGASLQEPSSSSNQESLIAEQPVQNDPISEQSFSTTKSPIVESPISRQFSTTVKNRPAAISSPSFSGADLSGTHLTQTINEQNRITSPIMDTSQNSAITPQITFHDSPSDFGGYLNSIDHSINQCRDNIADHWELNHLMEQFDPNEWPEMLLDDSVHNDMESLDYNVNSNQTMPKRNPNKPITNSVPDSSPLLNIPLNTPLKTTPKK